MKNRNIKNNLMIIATGITTYLLNKCSVIAELVIGGALCIR